MRASERLKELGIELGDPAAAVATYVPYVVTGNLVIVSGQVPLGPNGPAYLGKVGVDVDFDTAVKAARHCGIQILAQLKAACGGDIDRVKRIVRLGGFVNCIDGYADQPKVINGASDLMVEVFGDAGRHARAAVGVNALPLNVPVEVDCIAEIDPA